MKTMWFTVLIAASSALAASSSTMQVYAMDASGNEHQVLYTDSAWEWLEVPLSALGNTLPSDLKLTASGLPEGVTITLKAKKTFNTMAALRVEVKRTAAAKKSRVDSMATITLTSGTQELTTVQIPVSGVGYEQ